MVMEFTRHKKVTYWKDIFGLHIGKIYEDYDSTRDKKIAYRRDI